MNRPLDGSFFLTLGCLFVLACSSGNNGGNSQAGSGGASSHGGAAVGSGGSGGAGGAGTGGQAGGSGGVASGGASGSQGSGGSAGGAGGSAGLSAAGGAGAAGTTGSGGSPSGGSAGGAGGSAGSSAAGGAGAAGSQVPPADGRCGLTPQLVVAASTFPVPTDAGSVTSGVGNIIATGSDLYYTIWVYPVVSPGLGAAFFDASLLRVSKSGGQPTLIASGSLFFGGWALTPTSLIVGENTSSHSDVILSVPLAGGPPTTVLTCNDGDDLASGLATDGTYVYFGDGNGVEAVPLAPTSDSPAVITLTSDIPGTLAVLGQQLILALPEGGVESVPLPLLANSAVTQRGTAGAGQDDMQPCGSNVCWLSEEPNEIWQMNPANGAPTTLATLPFADAWGLTFDGSNFYLAGTDSNSSTVNLGRISADGSDSVVLVTMKSGGAHAVDDECVYWANSEGIYSLAKTAHGPFNQ